MELRMMKGDWGPVISRSHALRGNAYGASTVVRYGFPRGSMGTRKK